MLRVTVEPAHIIEGRPLAVLRCPTCTSEIFVHNVTPMICPTCKNRLPNVSDMIMRKGLPETYALVIMANVVHYHLKGAG